MTVLVYAIYKFCDVLTMLLFARAILSWFINPYRPAPYILQQINALLIRITEPLVAPCRSLLRNFNTGMFDFSILVAMLAIVLIRNIIVRIF
ncbi:MAG: YggT family protein [Clostridiales Family XIII bacterium]|nr:YggT family protein [Clostridiales Family XIII bacterium]